MFLSRSKSELVRVPAKNLYSSSLCDTHSCSMCDEGGWSSETEVAIHKKVCHKREIAKLVKNSSMAQPVCFLCFAQPPNYKSLVRHYKEEHLFSSRDAIRVEREIYICDNCNQIFFNKLLLEVHIHNRHMKTFFKQKITCSLCSRRVYLTNMYTHFQSHDIQSVSSCPICLEKCTNKLILHRHIADTHRKHYVCNICGFSTTREELFSNHLNTYTSKAKSRNKDVDAERYFLKARRKKMWIHAIPCYGLKGLQLYNGINICILCRHICVNKSEMKNHIRRDHYTYKLDVPKKLHQCSCGEAYDNGVLLKHHLFKNKGSDHRAMKDMKPKELNSNIDNVTEVLINDDAVKNFTLSLINLIET